METSVIIISKYNNDIKNEYIKYFDKVYIIDSLDKITDLFNNINSDYIAVITDEFYAEDIFILYTYIKSHNFDFVVGNRINTHTYNDINKFYKMCNKKASNRLSKLTNCYIPDLFSTSYVLSKSFYKNLSINSNFQLDCLKQSKNFAYIDIKCRNKHYSMFYIIKSYINAKLYRKDL